MVGSALVFSFTRRFRNCDNQRKQDYMKKKQSIGTDIIRYRILETIPARAPREKIAGNASIFNSEKEKHLKLIETV